MLSVMPTEISRNLTLVQPSISFVVSVYIYLTVHSLESSLLTLWPFISLTMADAIYFATSCIEEQQQEEEEEI